MFIHVAYKDTPELSNMRIDSMSDTDMSVEKTLLVNPECPIRIVLEYIRKKCKLGIYTTFDLCNESGNLMGLFNLNTFAYAMQMFDHKRTYYIIVLKTELDKRITVIPQVNRENKLYQVLKERVTKFLTTGSTSVTGSSAVSSAGRHSPVGKATTVKPKQSKKLN